PRGSLRAMGDLIGRLIFLYCQSHGANPLLWLRTEARIDLFELQSPLLFHLDRYRLACGLAGLLDAPTGESEGIPPNCLSLQLAALRISVTGFVDTHDN